LILVIIKLYIVHFHESKVIFYRDVKSTFNIPSENDCFPTYASSSYIDYSESLITNGTASGTAIKNGFLIYEGRSNGADNCWLSGGAGNNVVTEVRGVTDSLLTWRSQIILKGQSWGIDVHNLKSATVYRFFICAGQPSMIKY